MRAFLAIVLVLSVSLGLGIGIAWFLKPETNVTGPGFDPNFVAPLESGERQVVMPQNRNVEGASLSAADEWTIRNNKALDILKAGDMALALAEFRACHQAQPDNTIFLRNLVETMARIARGLWSQGDRQEAIWRLEDALEYAEGLPALDRREDLKLLLERWLREFKVEGEFWQDMSIHFELSYDARHEDLVLGYQEVLDRAEAAYADLRDFFGFDPVFERGRRMRITLYRRAKFAEVTGLASWAGGAFDGTVRLPVNNLNDDLHQMSLLLRHELTHAFLDAAPTHGAVPGWLNEGLAQYLSGEKEIVLKRARAVLDGHLVPLAELTGAFSSLSDSNSVARAYTQSLVAVDAIAYRFGERMLAELIAELTLPIDEAAEKVTPQARLEAAFLAKTSWPLDDLVIEHIGQL